MTGPKGNREFCFPETLNVPRGFTLGNIEGLPLRGEEERNIEGRGQTKLTVSRGASHLIFCYTSQLKNRKYEEK